MTANAPFILNDLQTQAEAAGKRHGLCEKDAASMARDLVEFLRVNWGGSPMYIPKGIDLDIHRRNAAIYEKFDGSNIEALCLEYGMTQQRMYAILKVHREQSRPTQADKR